MPGKSIACTTNPAQFKRRRHDTGDPIAGKGAKKIRFDLYANRSARRALAPAYFSARLPRALQLTWFRSFVMNREILRRSHAQSNLVSFDLQHVNNNIIPDAHALTHTTADN
jgi:hypothetical protein